MATVRAQIDSQRRCTSRAGQPARDTSPGSEKSRLQRIGAEDRVEAWRGCLWVWVWVWVQVGCGCRAPADLTQHGQDKAAVHFAQTLKASPCLQGSGRKRLRHPTLEGFSRAGGSPPNEMGVEGHKCGRHQPPHRQQLVHVLHAACVQ